MYSTCIFCAKDLGRNETLEHFPVGTRVSFDAAKGRLWAICPRCTRWNLAPIEERWEAVEEAEERFRGARLRVQSENIGMAKMPDGTRLIRVGGALPGELAAWRYGSQLVKRRRQLYLTIGASVVAGGAIVAGLPLIAGIGIPATMLNPAIQMSNVVIQHRAKMRVMMNLSAEESPTGAPLILRSGHLASAQLTQEGGDVAVSIARPVERDVPWYRFRRAFDADPGESLVITGDKAQLLAARTMAAYNSKGANRKTVDAALARLTAAGSAQDFISQVARETPVIAPLANRRRGRAVGTIITPGMVVGSFKGRPIPMMPSGPDTGLHRLESVDALALEMALHDESERRAMEGELDLLEDAWREAESIARIADALPGEPPEE